MTTVSVNLPLSNIATAAHHCLASPPIDSLPAAYFSTLLASIGFMIVFAIPVIVVQGLLHLEGLQKRLPFLSGVLKRHRFYPIFKDDAAQVLIELDCKDELCGRMEEMYKKFPKAYSQFPSTSNDLCKDIPLSHCEGRDGNTKLQELEDIKSGNLPIQSWMKTPFLGRFYSVHNFVANLQQGGLQIQSQLEVLRDTHERDHGTMTAILFNQMTSLRGLAKIFWCVEKKLYYGIEVI